MLGSDPGSAAAVAGAPGNRKAFTFLAVAAVLWILHGLLIPVGIVLFLSIGLSVGGVGSATSLGLAGASAFFASLALLAVAAILIAAVLFEARRAHLPPAGSRVALLAPAFFILYAATAVLSLVAGLLASGVLAVLDLAGFLNAMRILLASWALSAVVLAALGLLAPRAARNLGLQARGKPVFGRLFTAYAFVGAAVLLLAAPSALVLGATGPEWYAVPAILGAFLGLLLAPFLGIAVFAVVLRAALSGRSSSPG